MLPKLVRFGTPIIGTLIIFKFASARLFLWLLTVFCSCSCCWHRVQLQSLAMQCTGFAVASGIAIPSGTGIMEKLHGPLIVLFGIAAALIGGLLCRYFAHGFHTASAILWAA